MENISDPRLMEQIAKESGAKIGGTVYSDALSDEKGPAPTYIEMMRNNIGRFQGGSGELSRRRSEANRRSR